MNYCRVLTQIFTGSMFWQRGAKCSVRKDEEINIPVVAQRSYIWSNTGDRHKQLWF